MQDNKTPNLMLHQNLTYAPLLQGTDTLLCLSCLTYRFDLSKLRTLKTSRS